MLADKFPKIIRQTPNHRSRKFKHKKSRINTKISILGHFIFKLQQIKYKEKILKEVRGKNSPYLQRNKDNNYSRISNTNHASKNRV